MQSNRQRLIPAYLDDSQVEGGVTLAIVESDFVTKDGDKVYFGYNGPVQVNVFGHWSFVDLEEKGIYGHWYSNNYRRLPFVKGSSVGFWTWLENNQISLKVGEDPYLASLKIKGPTGMINRFVDRTYNFFKGQRSNV